MSVCGRLYPSFLYIRLMSCCSVTSHFENRFTSSGQIFTSNVFVLLLLFSFFRLCEQSFLHVMLCLNLVHNKVEKMLEMTAVSLIGGPWSFKKNIILKYECLRKKRKDFTLTLQYYPVFLFLFCIFGNVLIRL